MAQINLKTSEIINAYNVLNKLNFHALETTEIMLLLHAKKAFRPIVKDFEAFVEDARKSVIPAEFAEISRKMQAKEPLTADEEAMIRDVDKRLSEMVLNENQKAVTLDLELMSEDTLLKLFKDCELKAVDEDFIYFLFE